MGYRIVDSNILETDADFVVIPTGKEPDPNVTKHSVEGAFRTVFSLHNEKPEDNIFYKLREKLGTIESYTPYFVDAIEYSDKNSVRKQNWKFGAFDKYKGLNNIKKYIFIYTGMTIEEVELSYDNIYVAIQELLDEKDEFKNAKKVAIPLLASGVLKMHPDNAKIAATYIFNSYYNGSFSDRYEHVLDIDIHHLVPNKNLSLSQEEFDRLVKELKKHARGKYKNEENDKILEFYYSYSEEEKIAFCAEDPLRWRELMIYNGAAAPAEVYEIISKMNVDRYREELQNEYEVISNKSLDDVIIEKNELGITNAKIASILGMDSSNYAKCCQKVGAKYNRDGIRNLAIFLGEDIIGINSWIMAFARKPKLLDANEVKDQIAVLYSELDEESKKRSKISIEKELNKIKTKTKSIMK